MKNVITSYRALDLENDVVGGSDVESFPISTIPVLTKHDRGRSKVLAKSDEEKKMSVCAGHEFGYALYVSISW